MGRISSESQQNEITASHFSHPHPLHLISYQTSPNSSLNYSCSACKLKPSGMIYSCTICRFFLHKNCYQMPIQITHPSHKDHAFDLLPESAYADGAYSCDACSEAGTGFVYHCKPCGIDLHTLCTTMPLNLATPLHAHHLHLHFESPYPDKRFRCDVCSVEGSNHWLYRCSLCGFDAHLKCVSASAPSPSPAPPLGNPLQAAVAAVAAAPYAAVGIPAASPNLAAFSANRQQSDRLAQLQDLIQVIHNNNAAVTPGGAAGFGGGGSGLPQLTQFMSGLTSNVSVVGGGSGIPGLNAFGGGAGQQFLQALMNDGGGGSLNAFSGGGGQQVLQALMNGGGGGGGSSLNAFGGGGGQEFLQSLLNGGSGGAEAMIQSLLGGGGFDFLGGVAGFF